MITDSRTTIVNSDGIKFHPVGNDRNYHYFA